ncbi:uncharacterized protein LOC129896043 [Solanum dulcamara]|uniref:uncharacterized protein LOC129896043 n=1 Tax=Solanum dulcamara TaxID=45834 RepID=UPI0024857019|nr:uncharacterized protein LOC129896043 [Solanum dulcamara]
MTLEDMYNAWYNFDEHDDDCYWEPSEKQIEVLKWFCTMINVKDVDNCEKSAKRESDMTLEDMYNARYNFDEHDDDCYWEPSEKQIEVLKWFCTMINVKDVGNCEVCKEHRESGVLRHGFFASPYLPVEDVSQDELPVTENSEDNLEITCADSRCCVMPHESKNMVSKYVPMCLLL